MTTYSSNVQIGTSGFSDVHDITGYAEKLLQQSRIHNGVLVLFVNGSTAGITTIEFERGAVDDLKKAIERLAPQNIRYDHDTRWGDGNGFAHVRASLLGPSLAVPVKDGRLTLGTWQQIILVDFDNRPRTREVIVQIIGD